MSNVILDAMREQLEALKKQSFKLSADEEDAADIAKQIDEQQKRVDAEATARLVAEADVAKARVVASGYKGPLRAIYNLNAHKLSDGKVGWLVVGPTDAGKSIQIMKGSGKYQPGEGVKVLVSDPDEFIAAVELAILAAPEFNEYPIREFGTRQVIGRVLQGVPEWARAVYSVAQELAGGEAKETGKK